MKPLRIVAIIGALLLMVGEAYRSWGVGRPVAFWMDDMLAGAMMIAAAIAVRNPTRATRSFFSAAWGVSVGMLYGSFFGKLFDPTRSDPGNFSLGLLTALIGVAFLIAIAGLIASILLPDTVTT
ncbi:hypothetical protein [Sphingomonas sp. ERG5]|uniref:hypothetical protein n=1 Tax=Sphingomonas sp. ERG5 TaxID=1381597 RepID=UPI00054C768D|nr:hypothetical protein [Sphingomonas sp. ERG5]